MPTVLPPEKADKLSRKVIRSFYAELVELVQNNTNNSTLAAFQKNYIKFLKNVANNVHQKNEIILSQFNAIRDLFPQYPAQYLDFIANDLQGMGKKSKLLFENSSMHEFIEGLNNLEYKKTDITSFPLHFQTSSKDKLMGSPTLSFKKVIPEVHPSVDPNNNNNNNNNNMQSRSERLISKFNGLAIDYSSDPQFLLHTNHDFIATRAYQNAQYLFAAQHFRRSIAALEKMMEMSLPVINLLEAQKRNLALSLYDGSLALDKEESNRKVELCNRAAKYVRTIVNKTEDDFRFLSKLYQLLGDLEVTRHKPLHALRAYQSALINLEKFSQRPLSEVHAEDSLAKNLINKLVTTLANLSAQDQSEFDVFPISPFRNKILRKYCEIHLKEGVVLYNTSQFTQAIQEFNLALLGLEYLPSTVVNAKDKQDRSIAHANIFHSAKDYGLQMLNQKAIAEAERVFYAAIKHAKQTINPDALIPDIMLVLYHLGLSYLENKQFQEAVKVLRFGFQEACYVPASNGMAAFFKINRENNDEAHLTKQLLIAYTESMISLTDLNKHEEVLQINTEVLELLSAPGMMPALAFNDYRDSLTSLILTLVHIGDRQFEKNKVLGLLQYRQIYQLASQISELEQEAKHIMQRIGHYYVSEADAAFTKQQWGEAIGWYQTAKEVVGNKLPNFGPFIQHRIAQVFIKSSEHRTDVNKKFVDLAKGVIQLSKLESVKYADVKFLNQLKSKLSQLALHVDNEYLNLFKNEPHLQGLFKEHEKPKSLSQAGYFQPAKPKDNEPEPDPNNNNNNPKM
ncbi:MAG: hypothetical protein H0W64_11850 [Gammaproteobacteria bacterium]|nr:hypothetical protein [Gammaproteobacteria bacterium]